MQLRKLSSRSTAALFAAVITLGITAAACAPLPPVPPTEGASITVTPEPTAVADGDVLTVDGSGFNPLGNLGTRPPLFNQPAGVYVVFGRFDDPWKPSEGAPGSSRQIIEQRWALPLASFNAMSGATNPEIILMEADGSFTVDIPVSEAAGTGDYAVATYAGSGAVNSGEEFLVPVTIAP